MPETQSPLTTSTDAPSPNNPLTVGDLVFVYNGPGLVTRLEGWALSVVEMLFGDGPDATRKRMVAVYRNADGELDISAFVSPLAAVEASWHLLKPTSNDICGGGPRGQEPSLSREELEDLRDSGRYKFLKDSVPFYGVPSTAQVSPSADADWVCEAPSEAVFRGARGGMYRWYEPDAAPSDRPDASAEPATEPDKASRQVGDGPYAEALAAATKAGVRHTDDAGLMALFCADSLPHLVGAVSSQLVWEGAQHRGLSTADLVSLCAKDVMAVEELQWVTG
ncbi:hypothetical protein ACM01_14865 [Streptomyces viridochromogenes]|uniref:Uncharacterized protein n=1 Tax=Streptomyces viridochromogenes TaxID=1938 RepID=A0A0J8C8I1_STRVR|nr:hypothetical protein [Streptomyces viridochromogenes]KMS74200.1 hypothetical protein ACM01_14865 [Streptomyces viridochromogenes]